MTDLATGYVLVQSGEDTLMLWDTPGFGDTARLLSRLSMSGNPIGWFLTQVWDRWRERPLWSSQQAVKNAREQADVILYLVNAAEDPAAASYVALEMEVLGWIGKPVVVLLNQMGPPREDVTAEIARWSGIGAAGPGARRRCRSTPSLAAGCRKIALLDTVAPLLPPEKQPAMAGLRRRWEELNRARFDSSMDVLARYLLRAARDREAVDEPGWQGKVAGRVDRQDRRRSGGAQGDGRARHPAGRSHRRIDRRADPPAQSLGQGRAQGARARQRRLRAPGQDARRRGGGAGRPVLRRGRRAGGRPRRRRADPGRRHDRRRDPWRARRDRASPRASTSRAARMARACAGRASSSSA